MYSKHRADVINVIGCSWFARAAQTADKLEPRQYYPCIHSSSAGETDGKDVYVSEQILISVCKLSRRRTPHTSLYNVHTCGFQLWYPALRANNLSTRYLYITVLILFTVSLLVPDVVFYVLTTFKVNCPLNKSRYFSRITPILNFEIRRNYRPSPSRLLDEADPTMCERLNSEMFLKKVKGVMQPKNPP